MPQGGRLGSRCSLISHYLPEAPGWFLGCLKPLLSPTGVGQVCSHSCLLLLIPAPNKPRPLPCHICERNARVLLLPSAPGRSPGTDLGNPKVLSSWVMQHLGAPQAGFSPTWNGRTMESLVDNSSPLLVQVLNMPHCGDSSPLV